MVTLCMHFYKCIRIRRFCASEKMMILMRLLEKLKQIRIET